MQTNLASKSFEQIITLTYHKICLDGSMFSKKHVTNQPIRLCEVVWSLLGIPDAYQCWRLPNPWRILQWSRNITIQTTLMCVLLRSVGRKWRWSRITPPTEQTGYWHSGWLISRMRPNPACHALTLPSSGRDGTCSIHHGAPLTEYLDSTHVSGSSHVYDSATEVSRTPDNLGQPDAYKQC